MLEMKKQKFLASSSMYKDKWLENIFNKNCYITKNLNDIKFFKTLKNTFVFLKTKNKITKKSSIRNLKFIDINNIYLKEGDINETVPDFVSKYKEIRIALLHIDVDLYQPTKTCLENFYPHIVKGGIIILDDYGAFPGANKAIEEFFKEKDTKIEQLNFSNSISFVTKTR